MSTTGSSDQDRWEELQIDSLLFGLTPDEQAEYETLANNKPAGQPDSFERVVASIDLAWSDLNSMPLPEHVRRAIREQAVKELNSKPPLLAKTSVVDRPVGRSNRFPWAMAAACVVLMVVTLVSTRPAKEVVQNAARLRTKLIASAKDLVDVKWSDGPTPIGGAEGDVVWSPGRQQGFMRFRGLPVNEPTKQQYQLWIFDKNQDEKTPIDGGVFDISSDGEVIIPIRAKLRVTEAYLFAVTIEKPGGVVVSSRERLPLLAMVKKS